MTTAAPYLLAGVLADLMLLAVGVAFASRRMVGSLASLTTGADGDTFYANCGCNTDLLAEFPDPSGMPIDLSNNSAVDMA